MKKFKPLYTFASLWKQFVMFTKNWRRKSTGELVNKDTLELTGDVKCFENIVDKDGHKRFIEGNIEIETIGGLTKTYGKWSLSGSHLMIVIACDVENSSAITGTKLADVSVPSWVKDKIVPITGNYVSFGQFTAYGSDLTSQTVNAYLRKVSDAIRVDIGSVTASADRSFRIQFDLLIDNAESE